MGQEGRARGEPNPLVPHPLSPSQGHRLVSQLIPQVCAGQWGPWRAGAGLQIRVGWKGAAATQTP